jgi:Outer membrane protein beta-barrel domain
MKEKACCCYRFTFLKLIIMKKIFIKLLGNLPWLFFQITAAGFLIFYLTGCSCTQWCGMWNGGKSCEETCEQKGISTNKETTNAPAAIKSTEPTSDSVVSVGNPIPKKKAPGQIEGPLPGEFFSNTISFGTAFNFKSSNEDYGGGYGKHKPGIGFNIGVGTVLPFNKNWAIAPAIRFTQKNASEELGYSDPGGGGGGMQFTDKYSYNYLGTTILAQYRAGKHVSIVAGPEVNFLVASSLKNGGSSGTGEKQSLNKNSNKLGLDLLAGIKFEIPAKNSRAKWGVQLMYDHRLSRLNKKKDENGQDVAAYKMKSVQLGLAYNICGCGKKK